MSLPVFPIEQPPKTAKIRLSTVKDSDGWQELAHELGIKWPRSSQIFEYGEYADLEIVVDENLNIVGGRIIPMNADWRNTPEEQK